MHSVVSADQHMLFMFGLFCLATLKFSTKLQTFNINVNLARLSLYSGRYDVVYNKAHETLNDNM